MHRVGFELAEILLYMATFPPRAWQASFKPSQAVRLGRPSSAANRRGLSGARRRSARSGLEGSLPCPWREGCYNGIMHWLARLAIIVGGNALALWVANTYVPGFVLSANWVTLILIALTLAVLNFLLKPILTLALGPIIILTLGLGVLVVNAIILYLLPIVADHIDFLHGSIIIQNIPALFFATLIVSIINFIIHLAL
jgi:putative membrane protein